jgi:beta-glucosidase
LFDDGLGCAGINHGVAQALRREFSLSSAKWCLSSNIPEQTALRIGSITGALRRRRYERPVSAELDGDAERVQVQVAAILMLQTSNTGSVLKFPANFLWGTATSSTQVEGCVVNEWTNFTARDGKNCQIACNSYNRYHEDVEWMTQLGVKAHRLSIEWSRLQSAPFAPLDEFELARYRDVLERMKAAGITPMVVLHHFSNPPWIISSGGWLNPATVSAFLDYVKKISTALRHQVRIWNTFNEPDTYASCTYVIGEFPPHDKWRLMAFRKVIHHMAQAHVQACEILRRQGSALGPVEVGFSKNWTFFEPFKKTSLWDHGVAAVSHALFNHFVLRSFLGGGRKESSTFLGLNYYGRVRYHHFRPLIPTFGFSCEQLAKMGVICDDMFERHPNGMEVVLGQLQKQYHLPMYVTEHGSASSDEAFRERDLKQNLAALHRAIGAGADVRGFFYWSLLDNFEWQFGYSKKFGLVEVDFADETLPRRMKALGHFYRKICSENSICRH